MIIARISELKNQLSRYLRAVRRGEEIEVQDRKVPIARILPIPKGGAGAKGRSAKDRDEFFDEQVRLGVLRRGHADLSKKFMKSLPPGKPGVLAALITERREGR